jgi:hypothetical protein
MTAARRDWLATFADEATLSDLFAAAREYHAEVDNCDPVACAHPEPMMMPIDLPQWIESKVKQLERERDTRAALEEQERAWRGVRNFEPAGRPGRRQTSLAEAS